MPGSEPAPRTGALWLASYPKSGNTWTRTFLHNLFAALEGKAGEQDINRMNAFTSWDMGAARYAERLGRPVTEVDKAEIARLRPAVQAQIVESIDGLSLLKTHHALVADRGVPTINFAVTAGAAYMIRNPLDVAVSFSHHMGVDIDQAIAVMARRDYETPVTEAVVYEVYGSWSQNVESWTRKPHRAIHVMRYEDMLTDPTAAFGALARHMRLSPTPEQLAAAIEASAFGKLQRQEDVHGFREKPKPAERFFRKGEAGEWREALTRRQVRQVVRDHHEQMARFGYLTDEIAHLAG